VRSDHQGRSGIIDENEYKRTLVKLMLEVRLEEMGYGVREVKLFAEKETPKREALEGIEPAELSEVAFDLMALFMYQYEGGERMMARRPEIRDLSQRSEIHHDEPRHPERRDEVEHAPQNEQTVLS
jgi:hypothetical protein